jgi:hypothetical protein
MKIVAGDICPCLGCKRKPRTGAILCDHHEQRLLPHVHRRYIGILAGFATDRMDLEMTVSQLAVLCALIGMNEGRLTARQVMEVIKRHRGGMSELQHYMKRC